MTTFKRELLKDVTVRHVGQTKQEFIFPWPFPFHAVSSCVCIFCTLLITETVKMRILLESFRHVAFSVVNCAVNHYTYFSYSHCKASGGACTILKLINLLANLVHICKLFFFKLFLKTNLNLGYSIVVYFI